MSAPGERETFEWGFPAKGLKPFPAKRKQNKGHVPSPDSQLNPPREDSPDFRSRELPQQMFKVGCRGVSFTHVTVLIQRKFSNLSFQVGVHIDQ